MVFNYETYPQLTRLFGELNVPVKKTAMSFSVHHEDTGLEFCGSSLNHLFAQRRNLLRPSFYRMLLAIDRFNRDAVAALNDPALDTLTLGDYVRLRGYGADFLDLYLVPMSSAVWSTPPEKCSSFPPEPSCAFSTIMDFSASAPSTSGGPWMAAHRNTSAVSPHHGATASGAIHGSSASAAARLVPWSPRLMEFPSGSIT